MKKTLSKKNLINYLSSQLSNFFPDEKHNDYLAKLDSSMEASLSRTEYCFSKINNKYFQNDKKIIFNHLNGDQYAMFLYILSNQIYLDSEHLDLATKIYLLNKYLHGIDAYYEVELPKIFIFIHPLGTVLGRAKYSDFLVVYQRCGVGDNKGNSPILGEYLTLHPGASIIGKSVIKKNCSIGSNSLVKDFELAENKVFTGNPSSYKLFDNLEINQIWK